MKRIVFLVILFISSLSSLFSELVFDNTDQARQQTFELPLSFTPENVYSYEVGFSSSAVTEESESVGSIQGNAFELSTLQDGDYVYGSLTEGAYLYWKIISSENVTIYIALDEALSYSSGSSDNTAQEIDWKLEWDGSNPGSTYTDVYNYNFADNRYVHKHTGENGKRDINSVKLTIETEHIPVAGIGNYYAQRYEANIMVKVEAN